MGHWSVRKEKMGFYVVVLILLFYVGILRVCVVDAPWPGNFYRARGVVSGRRASSWHTHICRYMYVA